MNNPHAVWNTSKFQTYFHLNYYIILKNVLSVLSGSSIKEWKKIKFIIY